MCYRFISYKYGSMRRTALLSASEIRPDLRRFRLRLVDFLVSIWLLYALLRLIFPVPVALNRFAAPLFVFTFGMFILLYHTDDFMSGNAFLLNILQLYANDHRNYSCACKKFASTWACNCSADPIYDFGPTNMTNCRPSMFGSCRITQSSLNESAILLRASSPID